MSSGEEVWQNLKERADPFYASLGRHCLWLGPPRHGSMVEGLDLVLVERPAEASFILNTGPDDLDEEATGYRGLLIEARDRGLRMVCANADLHVMHGRNLIVCAGTLARRYEELGGEARWHGKPFRSVYETSLGLLGIADRQRVLAVGDSLRTDIAGAAGAGLDSLLVGGGIHGAELGLGPGRALDPERLAQLVAGKPEPSYALAWLAW
jgi:HAD superfamily hydrolase (TIGR01459 family)